MFTLIDAILLLGVVYVMGWLMLGHIFWPFTGEEYHEDEKTGQYFPNSLGEIEDGYKEQLANNSKAEKTSNKNTQKDSCMFSGENWRPKVMPEEEKDTVNSESNKNFIEFLRNKTKKEIRPAQPGPWNEWR